MNTQKTHWTVTEWKNALAKVGYWATDNIAEQVAEWAKSTKPLFVSGPQFGDKSMLIDSIIKILNKKNSISERNIVNMHRRMLPFNIS